MDDDEVVWQPYEEPEDTHYVATVAGCVVEVWESPLGTWTASVECESWEASAVLDTEAEAKVAAVALARRLAGGGT